MNHNHLQPKNETYLKVLPVGTHEEIASGMLACCRARYDYSVMPREGNSPFQALLSRRECIGEIRLAAVAELLCGDIACGEDFRKAVSLTIGLCLET